MNTFTEAVEQYLKETTWLGGDSPTAYGLRQAAAQLDRQWTTSLWAEYNKTIRYIESLKPVKTEEAKPDPLLTPVGPTLITRASSN